MHNSNGILFNHESPLRGETFVTRKITRAVARMALGLQSCLYLGNLDSRRDWGHARDFVRAMHLMVQEDEPGDYVIATGEQHSVREFAARAFAEVGIGLVFRGVGVDEEGVVESVDPVLLAKARNAYGPASGADDLVAGAVAVRVDPRYFRPTEVDALQGDPSKARLRLGWEPSVGFADLVHEMVWSDLGEAQRDELCRQQGFTVIGPGE